MLDTTDGTRVFSGPDDPRLEGWYHTIDFGGGIITKGHFDHRTVVDHYGIPASLEGMDVLDVGTADGFWAFELERRGARSVTTIDVGSLGEADWLPAARARLSPEYIASQQWGERFALAKAALGSQVRREVLSVYDLTPERLGTFDLVFSGDMLLHLTNPVLALVNIRSVTRGTAVIETVREPTLEAQHPDRPFMQFGVLDEEAAPGANITYWKFTTRALQDMLLYAGFAEVEPQPIFDLPPWGLTATSVVARA